MHLSWTLSRYFARHFIVAMLITLSVFIGLIYMIDLVEMMRRAASHDGLSFGVIAQMTLLRLPTIVTSTLPFAMLFGSMAAFMRLTRSSELVVARAAGVSVWQFLAPAIMVALTIGMISVMIVNPIAATLESRYEQLEARFLKGRSSLLAVSSNGLWLRQADPDGQSVIHALKVSDHGIKLGDVIIFLYGQNDQFLGRIDANSAELRDGYWALDDLWYSMSNQPPRHLDSFNQPTSLTPSQVQDSFASPDTISFWELPRFIQMAEAAGFTARQYRLHWHSLMSLPFLLCTMVLVAATFSLRTSRMGGLMQLVLGGVGAGFLLYFATDLSLALGLTGVVPPFLAAWAPAVVAMLLGLAALFHMEDG